jgi:hypothetical protein
MVIFKRIKGVSGLTRLEVSTVYHFDRVIRGSDVNLKILLIWEWDSDSIESPLIGWWLWLRILDSMDRVSSSVLVDRCFLNARSSCDFVGDSSFCWSWIWSEFCVQNVVWPWETLSAMWNSVPLSRSELCHFWSFRILTSSLVSVRVKFGILLFDDLLTQVVLRHTPSL